MADMNSQALVVSDLVIRRGTTRIVSGVSFSVPRGGSLGIVGESGCGKSTILKAIAGINHDWDGDIEVMGRRLGNQRKLAEQRSLQMVFQDPLAALNPAHTVDEALREPLIVHGIADHQTRVMHALQTVGLPASVRFRFPGQLSGGQRQRVCIARALMVQPDVLLLDEPTSALDVSVQAEVLNLLARLRREMSQTFVMVSHDLAVVAHMCDHIAVMVEGRFVEVFTRAELVDGKVQTAQARRLFAAAQPATTRRAS
ncbi:MAG: ABC transporter ATP-binding protein [Rhodoferax sp.]|jgi:peptide/nickel transport system ATP-binding protein|nr:ABC transporter ATP-binding protein [Rhodoferax sp.]